MPQLTAITGVDVQNAVIPLLQASALLTALFPIPATLPTILPDDPGTVDQATGTSIALHLLGESDLDGSLGPSGAGTRSVGFRFALICYVFEANRSQSQKQALALLTGNMRAALMQVRQDPQPSPVQRWYGADFYRDPASIYQSGSAFRRSITFVRFISRFRTL